MHSIRLTTPAVSDLDGVAGALASWQYDGAALQLHPGDLGWHSTKGTEATASALRVWSLGQRIVAIGLLDGATLLRVAMDPEWTGAEHLAREMARAVDDPEAEILPAGAVSIESRGLPLFAEALVERGWDLDELWTPLRRDLTTAVEDPGVRVEIIGPDQAGEWMWAHAAAFRSAPLSDEDRRRRLQGWLTMASGPFADSGRSLAAINDEGEIVAVATVWSAGDGRPGLIEPMGVPSDHRGHGYGTAITRAAAAHLRDMGASSAVVGTPTSNVGGVATYVAAGFTAEEPVADFHRPA